jgi:hypothetical protein
MRLQFHSYGNEKQKEVYRFWADKETTDIVYGGSKGSGKSYLGAALIFGDALLYPGTNYFIARKELNDLVKFTIPTIFEVLNNWKIPPDYYEYNGQNNFFTLRNGSKVYLISAKTLPSDPLFERFGSMQMTRGWIEEAGEFQKAAKNNLFATIGRWKNDVHGITGKLLQTCNPSKNYLFQDYYLPFTKGNQRPWQKFIQALPQDNKKLPEGYVENLLRVLSRSEVERLLRGNWFYDSDPTLLCDYEAISDCFSNDHLKGGPKAISADLAMQGRDRFVVGYWIGNLCEIVVDKEKATGKIIEEDLRLVMTKHGVGHSQTVVDSDGLGNYLASYLEGIKEFRGGAKAVRNTEFANLKSECAYKLAELINRREVRIICTLEQQERITTELGVLKSRSVDNDEKRKAIISKDEMKQLLGHSPDYVDMLIYRMYFLVRKPLQIFEGLPPASDEPLQWKPWKDPDPDWTIYHR